MFKKINTFNMHLFKKLIYFDPSFSVAIIEVHTAKNILILTVIDVLRESSENIKNSRS